MIVPSGSPIWTRAAVHTQYGGDVNKRNLLSVGVVDAQTDVGAEQLARLVADMEAIARTAPFLIINYTNNDTAPAAPTVNTVYMMTGVNTTTYAGNAPPLGFPSGARNGTGDVTFTLSASYSDPYGAAGAFTIRHAIATIYGNNANARNVTYEVPTSSTVRVHVFDQTGAAVGNDRVTLAVW